MKKKSSNNISLFGISLLIIIAALVLYRFGERWLRLLLISLSHSTFARNIVERLPVARVVARRFVAGESLEEAMAATRALNARGMLVTLDHLGESVTDRNVALSARDEILKLLDRINDAGLNANVSVKLTQLGLRIDEQLALENMRQILARAKQHGNKVRIDMEESEVVDTTLEIYQQLKERHQFDNVGVVIQAYLYRSEADVKELANDGAWIRLCKGAYAEPPDIAFPEKRDTDANFMALTRFLLSQKARDNGVYLGVATHDEQMINETLALATAEGIDPEEFEFQMLYGIRRDLQEELVKQGYRVRIYVPYGTAWYPYFVRRLAERPANLLFFIRNLFKQ